MSVALCRASRRALNASPILLCRAAEAVSQPVSQSVRKRASERASERTSLSDGRRVEPAIGTRLVPTSFSQPLGLTPHHHQHHKSVFDFDLRSVSFHHIFSSFQYFLSCARGGGGGGGGESRQRTAAKSITISESVNSRRQTADFRADRGERRESGFEGEGEGNKPHGRTLNEIELISEAVRNLQYQLDSDRVLDIHAASPSPPLPFPTLSFARTRSRAQPSSSGSADKPSG